MAELERRFGEAIHVNLVKGDRGVFDVVVDGALIFSKRQLGRFPGGREIIESIEALRSGR